MSSVPANTNLFYLVPQDQYDKYMKIKHDSVLSLDSFPKKILKKLKRLLNAFALLGIKWSAEGLVSEMEFDLPTGWNILECCGYSISNKGPEPSEFPLFMKLVLNAKIPLKHFSKVIVKKIKQYVRQQKKKTSETKKEDIPFRLQSETDLEQQA